MKKILSIISLLFTAFSFSQIIEANKVPEVLPPAPTVAAFMKFEEIPVSYYTGIPDVSVPIFSTKLKNGQSFEVKLGYHPASIIANEVASNCGLGWSLFAGGTISRTVKGFPDELLRTGGPGGAKIGIYTNSGTYKNSFYDYSNLLVNDLVGPTNEEMVNEYLWDVNVRGRFDTEHDLYQYNFMGYTGRFYIKKNGSALEVVKLDKNALIITLDSSYASSVHSLNSFTITDDSGNKYLFDVTENSTMSTPQYFYTYKSAFHLKEIRDINNILLADLSYSAAGAPEINNLSTMNVNWDKNNAIPAYNNIYGGHYNFSPLPRNEAIDNQMSTATRKLSSITIPGQCYINFDFQLGSSIPSLLQYNSSYRLNFIEIENWYHEKYKKFSFVHVYSNNNMGNGTTRNRMLLDRVNMYDKDNLLVSNYAFSYKEPQPAALLNRDAWGYFNKAECDYQNFETTPGYSDIDILKKMKYPEDGCTVFDFEANTYSYEGDSALSDFDANPENWQVSSQETKHFTGTTVGSYNTYAPINLNFSTQKQYLYISPHLTPDDDYNYYRTLSLYKGNQLVKTLMCPNECSDCKVRVELDANTQYNLRFANPSGTLITHDADLEYVQKISPVKEYLFGGGNRIKKILYFDSDVDINSIPAAQKEINFDYSFFSNINKSSGSLAYPKPLFTYEKSKRECPHLGNNFGVGFAYAGAEFDIEYDVITLTNNLAAIKTKGSDVGYKNVRVYEADNGFKKMIYTNSIDFPEVLEYENLNTPFLPTVNIDYKRGELLEEHIFNQQGNELKSTVNTYSYDEYVEITGINVYNPGGYVFNNPRQHEYYVDYKNYVNSPPTMGCFCCFDMPRQFTASALHKEAYGWVKLNSSVVKEYFLDPVTSTWNPVQTTKNYTYNPDNLQIAAESTSDANGGFLSTEYFYPKDASMSSKPNRSELIARNAVALKMVVKKYRSTTTTYAASDKLFEKETEYGSFTSNTAGYSLILPKYIYTKKGSAAGALNKEITFNYDTIGNLTEYTQEGGVPSSFIWGYDKTYPVAKIDNLAYATIPGTTVSTIQTATNTSNNETNILNALNALRTAFPNAMISTNTFIPLLGVTTSTDPKGDKIIFKYDGFQRLKEVRDSDNNIVSENKYHYKTQN